MDTKITSTKTNTPIIDAAEFEYLTTQAKQIKLSSGYAHRLESQFSGTLPTKKIGSGMDYAESRVYQAGDDPRFINWRLTARSNETLVKNFHTESSPSLSILMDRDNTMRFGTRKRLKITQAARVASLLSLASQQHRLALGGLILDENDSTHTAPGQWFPSSRNEQAFNNWIENIIEASPPTFTQTNKPKNWQLILQNLADKNPLGSIIYLVSDFLGLSNEQQTTLEVLRSKHYVIAIHISDPAEQSLANNGTLRFKDVKTQGLYQVKSGNQNLRERFETRSKDYQASIQKLFEDRGIPYIPISTTEDDLAPLLPLPLEAK